MLQLLRFLARKHANMKQGHITLYRNPAFDIIVPNRPGFVDCYAFVLYMLGNKVFVGVITKVAVKCRGTAT